MTNCLNDIYSSIVSRRRWLDKLRFYSALRFITRWTANVLLPIEYCCTRGKAAYRLSDTAREERIIVSLTTFPKRIHHVHLAIESILRGEVKPDKIILWLSRNQFDGHESLPSSLRALEQRGLEIRFMEGDIRSYKKFVYAIEEYKNDLLVTADDDIYYRTNWLKELVEMHKAYPEDVIVNYAFDIRYDAQGRRLPYTEWGNNVREGEHLFFGSGGGVLFPAGSLGQEAGKVDIALRVCPKADDVWLNAMVRMSGRAIRRTNYYSIILPVLIIGDERLATTNVESGNDAQIEALEAYYKQTIF